MMNKQPVQLRTFAEIDRFLQKQHCGTLDNMHENLFDAYYDAADESVFVKQFNKAIKSLFKLISR
jgi:hypothetical protein